MRIKSDAPPPLTVKLMLRSMLGVSHDYAAACRWLFHFSGNPLFMFMYKKESGVSGLIANDNIWLSLFQGPSFMLLPLKIDHVSCLPHCLCQYIEDIYGF